MANTKQIHITGWMPFDAGAALSLDDPEARKANSDLLRTIGQFHLPAMGTRLDWGHQRMVPNQWGGQTAMYEFTLRGEEALAWGALEAFKDLIRAVGGEITDDRTRDMDA